MTMGLDGAAKKRVSRKMLVTDGVVAIILVAPGEVFTRVLHSSTGLLSLAGGIILPIISLWVFKTRSRTRTRGSGHRVCHGARLTAGPCRRREGVPGSPAVPC